VLDESVDDGSGGNDDGTGAFIWGAGAALASYLYRSDVLRDQLRNSHVLELGCGTAVVSIAAAAAGAKRVLATDLPSRLQAAKRNVAANDALVGTGVVRVAALDWNEGEDGVRRVVAEDEDEDGFDLVFGADLTYEPAALGPLARTVAAAVRLGGGRRRGGGDARSPPTVLLAHRPRSREVDALMMQAFAAEGLALVEDGAELTGLDGDGGDKGGGDGEPLILYRVVLA
jgi:SAM-dependent methyltransferase